MRINEVVEFAKINSCEDIQQTYRHYIDEMYGADQIGVDEYLVEARTNALKFHKWLASNNTLLGTLVMCELGGEIPAYREFREYALEHNLDV